MPVELQKYQIPRKCGDCHSHLYRALRRFNAFDEVDGVFDLAYIGCQRCGTERPVQLTAREKAHPLEVNVRGYHVAVTSPQVAD